MPAAHIRVIACPNGGGFGGKSDPFNHEIVVAKAALLLGRPVKICLTREEVFYCHRGRHPVLMQLPHRRHEGRQDHRHAPADAARRRRLRLLRRGEHLLHRRAADGDLRAAALPLRGLPRRSPTSRPAGRSAATARRSRASARRSSSTRSPRRLGLDPAELRLQHGAPAGHAHRELAARSARSGSASASARSSTRSGWKDKHRQAAARAAASASPARPTSAAPGCRSTGTRCRTRACS